jgi:APA family basic amino acid/polyamine antiporter
VVTCVNLMMQLPLITWKRFGVWLAIGLVLYFVYGFKHSKLRAQASP